MPGCGTAQATESDTLIWLFTAALHAGPEDQFWTILSETQHNHLNNLDYYSQLYALSILHKRKEKK